MDQVFDAITSQLSQYIIAGLVAVVMASWAFFRKRLEPIQIVTYAILLFGGITYMFGVLGIEQSTRGKVRKWVDTPHFSVRSMPFEPPIDFGFEVEDRQGRTVLVVSEGSLISLQMKMVVSPRLLELFNRLTEREKREFTSRLRLALLNYGVGFRNLGDDLSKPIILVMETGIPQDQISFLKDLFLVRGAAQVFRELIKELEF